MIAAENIRDWRGHDVVDPDGHRIGTLESIYVDTVSDTPFFCTIIVGLPTRRRLVFAPLMGASVGPEYLKIHYSKDLVKDAPSIDTDGELLADQEWSVFDHYKLPFEPGARGERRLARR